MGPSRRFRKNPPTQFRKFKKGFRTVPYYCEGQILCRLRLPTFIDSQAGTKNEESFSQSAARIMMIIEGHQGALEGYHKTRRHITGPSQYTTLVNNNLFIP